MEKKEIVANLLKKEGSKEIKNLKIKNVTVTPCDKYTRLGLTLDKPVAGMVTKDNGNTYEEGETNVVFTSLYAVVAILKDDDDAAFAANHMLSHPDSMSIILSRATIDIIQERVVAGEEYKNPWSSSEEATIFTHDTIITHVINIKLSDFAVRKLDKIADSLLGI